MFSELDVVKSWKCWEISDYLVCMFLVFCFSPETQDAKKKKFNIFPYLTLINIFTLCYLETYFMKI